MAYSTARLGAYSAAGRAKRTQRTADGVQNLWTADSIQKLRRSDGATIVLAMLTLLAAAMYSMVILTAAVNAATAARGQYEMEQSYLCVSGAARLLNQEIVNPAEQVYRKTAVVKHNGNGSDQPGEQKWPQIFNLETILRSHGFEQEANHIKENPLYRPQPSDPLTVRQLLSYMYELCDRQDAAQTFTLTITLPLDNGTGRPVEAELTMTPTDQENAQFHLTILLSSVRVVGEKEYPVYKMQLEYGCTAHSAEETKRDAHYEPDEDGTPVLDYWEEASVTTTTLTWTLEKVGRGT